MMHRQFRMKKILQFILLLWVVAEVLQMSLTQRILCTCKWRPDMRVYPCWRWRNTASYSLGRGPGSCVWQLVGRGGTSFPCLSGDKPVFLTFSVACLILFLSRGTLVSPETCHWVTLLGISMRWRHEAEAEAEGRDEARHGASAFFFFFSSLGRQLKAEQKKI